MEWSDKNSIRYDRNIRLAELGRQGQERLFRSSVLVVGAGGLGSPVLLYLAAAGIGRIGIMDGDRLELTNLNRQVVHKDASIGRWKAESSAETLRAFRPDLAVDVHNKLLTAENACDTFCWYDIVVDATDSFPAKFLCNDAAVIMRRPLIHAGVIRFGGQLLTVLPGETACLRCLIPEIPPKEDSPSAAQIGVLGAAAGIVGAWQALEAVKLIAEIPPRPGGILLSLDTLSGETSRHIVPRDPACPACGDNPRISEPLTPAEYEQDQNQL
ncbi:MAG: TOMM precursor leader peptide-binding protein [Syntrophorhabdaceae bacterium]|nr:TOMM precursor leader peptide-binding protein [Syntrophorhabdaceae bacterium]